MPGPGWVLETTVKGIYQHIVPSVSWIHDRSVEYYHLESLHSEIT